MRETYDDIVKREKQTAKAHARIPRDEGEPIALVVNSYALAHNPKDQHAYTLRLRMDGRDLDTEFRAGIGHTTPPTMLGVLYCLVSDAGAAEMTHAEWCADFGFEEDSRKGLDLYLKCQRGGHDLLRWARAPLSLLQRVVYAWDSGETEDLPEDAQALLARLKDAPTVR